MAQIIFDDISRFETRIDTENVAYKLNLDGSEQPYTPSIQKVQFAKENFLPKDSELIKPIIERIPTPLDSRGLVDIRALIDSVVDYVDPEYEWRGPADLHHFYWFNGIYCNATLFNQKPELAVAFRTMPLHMVELPLGLHRFLHMLTLPVEVPEQQVMLDRMESWRVAKILFNSVKVIRNRKFLSNYEAARRVNQRTLKDKFKKIEESLEDIAMIPEEFVFFDTKPFEKILGADKVEHVKSVDLYWAHKQLREVGAVTHKRAVTLGNTALLVA